MRRFHPIALLLSALAFGHGGGEALLSAADRDDPGGAGPLYHRFRLTLEPGERTEALGPVYYEQHRWLEWPGEVDVLELPDEPSAVQDDAATVAFPPFFSLLRRPAVEGLSWDLFYPAITYDRYGSEYRLQIGQLLSFSGGRSQSDTESRGFSLFPLIFFRRSQDPTQNYSAVLPFYAHLHKRLFRDEVKAVLWPLYAQTRKKDVITDNYLVPLFHLRRGDGLDGWQLWPVAGHERKVPTARTNLFGDVEVAGAREALFVLWPLFFHNTVDIGATNEVRQRVFLPFYSFQLSAAKESRTYLWPVGPTFVDARQERYWQVGAPWPFIVFARGEGKTTDRVFPLYSHSQYRNGDTTWYLWPLYWHRTNRLESFDRELTRIGFFVYTDITDRNRETGQTRRRTDLWPLFIARKDQAGNERLQLLAPFEPLLAENPSVLRNWSPLWSVWRSERNVQTGASAQSFLWNLYRRETAPGVKKCSLLFGLIQYHTGPDGSGWRLLHLIGRQPVRGQPIQHVSEHR